VLAAKRAGIKNVILPERNRKDLEDVPANVKEGLEFHFIKRVDEIVDLAIGPKKEDIVLPTEEVSIGEPGSYAGMSSDSQKSVN
jgi:ATP-dependent Lon protease